MCVHVVNCGFSHPRVCVCVKEREAEAVTVAQMHSNCGAASHSHDPEFLLDYQQMEIKGEYAAAVLITDRSDLRPLNRPDPGYVWLPPHCTL